MKRLVSLFFCKSLFAATGNVVSYDTLDQLLSTANPTSVSTELAFKGRTTVNDGGGGVGIFVQGASPTNLGTIFNSQHPNGSGWQFKRQYEERINARWFGAKGTGIDDDTAAIEAAMAAGKKVYAPAGQYLVDALSIPSGVELFGDANKTVFKRDTIGKTIELDSSVFRTNVYLHDFTVKNAALSVPNSPIRQNDHCIAVNNCRGGITVERISFTEMVGDGIYIGRNNANVNIKDCTFYNITDAGVTYPMRNGISVISADGATITGNSFNYVTPQTTGAMPGPIDLEPNATDEVIRNIVISDNRFANCGGYATIQIANSAAKLTIPPVNITVTGNTIRNCAGPAFTVSQINFETPANIVFANNSCEGGWEVDSNRSRPFYIWRGNGISVANNMFTNYLYNVQIGSALSSEDFAVCKNITVSGNQFSGVCKTGGNPKVNILIYRMQQGRIENNRFTDLPSGTVGVIGLHTVSASVVATLTDTVIEGNDIYSTFTVPLVHLRDDSVLGTVTSGNWIYNNQYYGGARATVASGVQYSARGPLNIKDFGAKGTGTDDDTAAWNAAIAAAAGTTMVVLPSGSYLVNGTNIQGNSVTNAWVNLATGTPIAQQQQTVAFRSYEFDLPTIQAHTELAFDVLDPQAEAGQWFRAFHPEWPYLSIVGSCTSEGIVHIKLFNSNGIIINPMVETFIVMYGKTP